MNKPTPAEEIANSLNLMDRMRLLSAFQVLTLPGESYRVKKSDARRTITDMTGYQLTSEHVPDRSNYQLLEYLNWMIRVCD